MIRDLRWAMRCLRRNPLFATAVVLILGLGIGASTAAFSIADAVILRPLPYRSAAQLVRVEETSSKRISRHRKGATDAAHKSDPPPLHGSSRVPEGGQAIRDVTLRAGRREVSYRRLFRLAASNNSGRRFRCGVTE